MPDQGRQTPRSPQRKMRALKSQQLASSVDSDGTGSSSPVAMPPAFRTNDDKRRREERARSSSMAGSSRPASSGVLGSSTPVPPLIRSHTPGHLASKSQDRRRKPSEHSIRQRAQSSGSSAPPNAPSPSSSHLSMPPPPNAHNMNTPVPPPSSSGGLSRASTQSPRLSASVVDLRPPAASDASSVPSKLESSGGAASANGRRTMTMRSTSAIAIRPAPHGSGHAGGGSPAPLTGSRYVSVSRSHGRHVVADGGKADDKASDMVLPALVDPRTAPDVPPAPSSGMYWSKAPVSGASHPALRAHTTTLIGSSVYIFGGCDARTCFNDLYVMDADAFYWWRPTVVGDIPLPLRAMTCTAVGKKLVVFGGGDGPEYYNDVYVLDTTTFRWSRPRIATDRPMPSKRRAHTACLYKNGIYMFGGGDGVQALNDVWRLDVSDTAKMSWKLISAAQAVPPKGSSSSSSQQTVSSTASNGGGGGAGGNNGGSNGSSRDMQPRPRPRGYHTANMVGSKLVIFGGSDGGECFNDVWVYDVETRIWRAVSMPTAYRRLSHTATIIGSYLFVVGGHDGSEYSNDVLLLNLVTMVWDRRKVYGLPPSGRGYHGAILHDSRLLVIGGFDGGEVFGDVWILELAVHAYYSQISQFTVNV